MLIFDTDALSVGTIPKNEEDSFLVFKASREAFLDLDEKLKKANVVKSDGGKID